MDDCIFCKIVKGEIPVEPLASNTAAILIKDKNPIAPHHVLAIAKEHHTNSYWSNWGSLGDMMILIHKYVEENNLLESGYRIVSNSGPDAGQTVPHFHIHMLAGAKLKNDFGA